MKESKLICIVCLGNICRSPVAEVLLRYYSNLDGSTHIYISAGLMSSGGKMYTQSQDYLNSRGISTNKFKSQNLTQKIVDESDLLIVMEKYMKDEILQDYSVTHPENIITFNEAAGNIRVADIIDPYYENKSKYIGIMKEIDAGCKKILKGKYI